MLNERKLFFEKLILVYAFQVAFTFHKLAFRYQETETTMDRYNPNALPLYGNAAPRPPRAMGLGSHLQIGGKEVAASCCFWIFMCFLAFKGFQYGAMYMTFDDSSLDSTECCKNFGGTLQDNRNFIEGYNKRDAGPYLMRLGPETYTSQFKGTASPKELSEIPPIVTAVSSEDFFDVQGLIKQIHDEIQPVFKDVKFLIYDIGLYSRELELVSSQIITYIIGHRTFKHRGIYVSTMSERCVEVDTTLLCRYCFLVIDVTLF